MRSSARLYKPQNPSRAGAVIETGPVFYGFKLSPAECSVLFTQRGVLGGLREAASSRARPLPQTPAPRRARRSARKLAHETISGALNCR